MTQQQQQQPPKNHNFSNPRNVDDNIIMDQRNQEEEEHQRTIQQKKSHRKSHNHNHHQVRHCGQALIRGKIRWVWRPRYLELLDNGLIRYYEVPPDPPVTATTATEASLLSSSPSPSSRARSSPNTNNQHTNVSSNNIIKKTSTKTSSKTKKNPPPNEQTISTAASHLQPQQQQQSASLMSLSSSGSFVTIDEFDFALNQHNQQFYNNDKKNTGNRHLKQQKTQNQNQNVNQGTMIVGNEKTNHAEDIVVVEDYDDVNSNEAENDDNAVAVAVTVAVDEDEDEDGEYHENDDEVDCEDVHTNKITDDHLSTINTHKYTLTVIDGSYGADYSSGFPATPGIQPSSSSTLRSRHQQQLQHQHHQHHVAALSPPRILDVTTLRDMHVGLPRGTYGFTFRALKEVVIVQQQQELYPNNSNSLDVQHPSIRSNNSHNVHSNNVSNQIVESALALAPPASAGSTMTTTTTSIVSEPRDYLCAVATLEEAQMWVVALQWAASVVHTSPPSPSAAMTTYYNHPPTLSPLSSSTPWWTPITATKSMMTTTITTTHAGPDVGTSTVALSSRVPSLRREMQQQVVGEDDHQQLPKKQPRITSELDSHPVISQNRNKNTNDEKGRNHPATATTTTATTTTTTQTINTNDEMERKQNNAAIATMMKAQPRLEQPASKQQQLQQQRLMSKVIKYRTVRIPIVVEEPLQESTIGKMVQQERTDNNGINTIPIPIPRNSNSLSSTLSKKTSLSSFIPMFRFEIAYEIHCIILRPKLKSSTFDRYISTNHDDSLVKTSVSATTTTSNSTVIVAEEWIILRTADDFQQLVGNLCKELGPALLDRAQLGIIRQLPRFHSKPTSIQLYNSVGIVDSILRSYIMDNDIVHSNSMKSFLGLLASDNNNNTSKLHVQEETTTTDNHDSTAGKVVEEGIHPTRTVRIIDNVQSHATSASSNRFPQLVNNLVFQKMSTWTSSAIQNHSFAGAWFYYIHEHPDAALSRSTKEIIIPPNPQMEESAETTADVDANIVDFFDEYSKQWLVQKMILGSFAETDIATMLIQHPIWIVGGIGLTTIAVVPLARTIASTATVATTVVAATTGNSTTDTTASTTSRLPIMFTSYLFSFLQVPPPPSVLIRLDVLVATWMGAAYLGSAFTGKTKSASSSSTPSSSAPENDDPDKRRPYKEEEEVPRQLLREDEKERTSTNHLGTISSWFYDVIRMIRQVTDISSTSCMDKMSSTNGKYQEAASSSATSVSTGGRLELKPLENVRQTDNLGLEALGEQTPLQGDSSRSTSFLIPEKDCCDQIGDIDQDDDGVDLKLTRRNDIKDMEHHDNSSTDDDDDDDDRIASTTVEETRIPTESQQWSNHFTALPSPLPQYQPGDSYPASNCWSQPIVVSSNSNDNNRGNGSDDTRNCVVTFHVRGARYLQDRVKVPSGSPALWCRGVDIWITDNPERHIARHPAMLGGRLHEIDTFMVNFLLPFGNFVAYFGIPPLEDFPNDKVRDVWIKFLAGDQQYRDARLKLLPVVVEGPWIVKTAVGPGKTPALLGKVIPLQYFFRHPTATSTGSIKNGIYEVDVIITASTIAKGILSIVKGHTKSVSIAFAFIIEAAEQEELPETVLCSCTIHSIHLENCPPLPPCNLDDVQL